MLTATGRKFGSEELTRLSWISPLRPEPSSAHLDQVDALEADDVAVEKITLKLRRELAAADQAGAGARARRAVPELLHVRVFGGIINVTAEGRAKITVVARGVGDEVVAPVIEDAAMRIGEIVGDVGFKFSGARLKTVDGGVVVSHRAEGGFDVGAVEDAVAEINRAARVQTEGVGGVVRIGGVHAHEDPLDRPGVAVDFRHVPQIRRLHEQHAVLVKLETGRRVQIIHEMR